MIRRLSNRVTTTLLTTAIVATGLVTLAAPASATRSFTTIDRASWAHTDVRAPLRSFAGGTGDAPVGAWRDGAGYHLPSCISRST